jgi:hypothetical protein
MKVTLGQFARTGIESQLGTDLTAAVETAIRHYTGKLTYGRPPQPFPQFLGTDVSQDFGTHSESENQAEIVLDLALDFQTEALLRREAMKYDTDFGAIATHAVMVYLAELDFLTAPSRPA